MNMRLKNNALLHLAKSIHSTILGMILFAMFFISAQSNHYFLAFIIMVLYIVFQIIALAQLFLFVRNIRRANKK